MSEFEVAELLYLAHTATPLKSPFFEPLGNHFSYLGHDDGFYCKLYAQNLFDFASVLCKKIEKNFKKYTNSTGAEIATPIKKQLLDLAPSGLLIDFEEIRDYDSEIAVDLFLVGDYVDMDNLFYRWPQVKADAANIFRLVYKKKLQIWELQHMKGS